MSLFKPENMTIAEIIGKLQEAVDLGDSPHRGPFGTFIRKEYLVEAIEALKAHPDAQPNEPLTLEELRGMEGEPVWVRCISEPLLNGWQIVAGVDTEDCGTLYCEGEETFRYYGQAWLAYRRPPKED